MSNPPGSSTGGPTSAGAMSTGSPLPPTLSMSTSSLAQRSSARRKNAARSILDPIDSSTPSRRSTADDPALMMAGTVEFSDGDNTAEKASLARSSGKMVSQAADSAHHGDAISNRPKLMKMSLQATKASTRNAAVSPSPRSFLLKNLLSPSFLLLIVVAGLATTTWNWRAPPSVLHADSLEGQVAELEEILTKATKMLQVQLDLVDAKIYKEVEGVKKELEEKIDEQASKFGTELHNMLARTESIESSLKKVLDAGFPSKQDVLSLINSVVDQRAAEGSGKALSLDDVRAVARRMVEIEIEKHAADGIGRVDYALGSGGGKVVDHSEGFYHGLWFGWHLLASGFLPRASNIHPLANKILEPSFGEPGQCLPLKGSNVYAVIALRTDIYPEAFSLEHVSKSVAYDISSAPKEFRVFGWRDSFKKDDAAHNFMSEVPLGNFEYDIERKHVQTFTVPKDLTGKVINTVRLEVLSNYGSSSHTCIYRFRVHGTSKASMFNAVVHPNEREQSESK
ncbi:hypothetical protein KP509_12G038900 [Ceratopteris richardii]|uniref:SUN domain-containing protein n=1 Tax=Ceratopteris richardii TaxID=49495 RepID=A0A8T2TKB0_CERRI|nr:hypothetical protein KP509_12G038900 [Ceratopteris richardii]